jgi:hypothetical protein
VTESRLVRVLGAVTALMLVAAALFLFSRPARAVSRRAAASRVRSTTTVVPTTVPPTTTTAAPTTTITTVAPVPAVEANHRWRVGVTNYTFVDTTRPTGPAGTDPGQPSRTLPTTVRYPIDGPVTGPEVQGAAASRVGRPFPLIVFGHGYNTSPAVYGALLHAWASAGYVVAAPAFPRATAGGPLDENDVNQEPGDLSFVIGRLLAPGPMTGVIDPAHVGAAGHSDGAVAAIGAGYNTCCRDPRIAADALLAGDEHSFPGGGYFPPGSPPLLVVQADHDVFNPPPFGQQVYADAHAPKYYLGLVNATHLESVTTDQAHLNVVEAVTIGFFDRYLKGRAAGVAAMRQAAVAPLATFTAG